MLCGALWVLAAVAVPSWPGRINNDTVAFLRDIDDRDITNWGTPILQYLWMPFRDLGIDLGPVLVLQIAIVYLALVVILESMGIATARAALIGCLVCVHPVTYGLLSAVIRDTWFLALWLLALAIGRTHRISGGRRLAAMVTVVFFAYAARQNGIAIAPPLLFVASQGVRDRRGRQLGAPTRAVLAGVLTALIIFAMSLLTMVLPIRHERPGSVYMWDLVRFSLRSEQMLLPHELNPDGIDIDQLRELATPYNLDELLFRERRVPMMLDERGNAAAQTAWVRLVRDDPVEYLRMRWQLMSRQIGLSGNTRNPFLPTSIDNQFDIGPAFPGLAERATDYQLTFNQGDVWWVGGAVHRAWPMLLVAAAAAIMALLRRRTAPVAVDVAVTCAGVLATVFFFAPQLQFRFVAPVVVVSLVSAVALARPGSSAPADASAAMPARPVDGAVTPAVVDGDDEPPGHAADARRNGALSPTERR